MSEAPSKIPILKIENICKSFGKKNILDSLNFEIYEGEILSIFGLSGSGKSTFLKILCGFMNPDSGQIKTNYGDKKLRFQKVRNSELIRSLFGFASQEPSFYPNLTVVENLKYFGTILSVPKVDLKNRIEEILLILNLSEVRDTLSSELSEGMKKRLDIGCSIIHNPKILILDEPTANLDFRLRDELLDYVREINNVGMTIIFVSHYLDEVEKISGRIAILSNSYMELIENTGNLKSAFQKRMA